MYAEGNKSKGDKVTPGAELRGKYWNMAGSFMLFRGAAMQDDWVKPYADKVGQGIMLPQSTSCSKNPIVALGFAMPETIKDNQTTTFFVFACRNYNGIDGMTMNNEALSAYPKEAETLPTEGCFINILGIDYGIKILNDKDLIALFNVKKTFVIHLFHKY